MKRSLTLYVLALLHSARCGSYSRYGPIKRYHPTKFNSHGDLDPAESIQYAYEGGDSFSGGDFSKVRPGEVDLTSGQGGGLDFGQGHAGEVDITQGHPGEVDLTHGHSVIMEGSVHGGDGHNGGNSGSSDHLNGDLEHEASGPTGSVELPPDHGYDYPTHHGIELDHGGYHYDHPHGYEYLPPSGHHHVLEALPVITPPPPPPPAQAPKQSPTYTYYYLGRHLWYIPLYFSIYFIIYVGALVLKSVARHKILFPENLKVAAQAQDRALHHLDRGAQKFYM